MAAQHPEHEVEQRYIVDARTALEASMANVEVLLRTAQADSTNPDAMALAANLTGRLRRLRDAESQAACFARLDDEDEDTLYIGRQHIADAEHTPLVIDWRARAAEPFYRATPLNPMGCLRRRQFVLEGDALVEIYDTDMNDPEAGAGIPDPLLAEINRSRTGSMREIVATIQAEQDRIVRAPLDLTLVVQGGPGTGKTAVGLHRAAYLMFEHRDQLSREGVLIVGPNRRFLDYIQDVLPSLGERSSRQVVPADLGDIDLASPSALSSRHRRLVGDLRMAELIRLSLQAIPLVPEHDVRIRTDLGSATIEVSAARQHMQQIITDSERMGPARETWISGVIGDLRSQVMKRSEGFPTSTASDYSKAVRRSDAFKEFVKQHWPESKPEAVVRSIWRDSSENAGVMETAGFNVEEVSVLQERPARGKLTEVDRPLIDEAAWQLGARFIEYGHVVLDEAQDLSPMALRMVARRAKARSFTVLGDVAQCSGDWMYEDWDLPLRALASDATAVELAELTVGYRVPDEFIKLANALLPSIAPGLAPTASVRPALAPAVTRIVESQSLVEAVATRGEQLTDRWTSVAIIDADQTRLELLGDLVPENVDVLLPAEAKGLEFDAVLVVEPSNMEGTDGTNWRPLFVALTRAVQHLELIGSKPIPRALASLL